LGELVDNAVIWLVDAQPLLRAGLRAQLDGKGFQVAVDAATVEEAVQLTGGGASAHLIVIDHALGGSAVQKLKSIQPSARVVVLAEAAELSYLAEMFGAGADGYILKSISANALIESLRLVLLGEKVFPSILTNFLGAMQSQQTVTPSERVRVGDVALSQRELDIIRSLADGHTNKSIAKELSITEATVKVHIKTVLRKLGASNRTQVAIWAVQHGLTNGNHGFRPR
jgi:two-component system nitrate/nitrite response regulator NarL